MRIFPAFIGVAAISAVALLTAAVAPSAPPAIPAGSYVLDPHHSSLLAKLKHQSFSLYTLRFTGLEAHFDYDPAKLDATKLSVTVDAHTIDTATGGDAFGKAFDTELLGADWLDGQRYPTMTFTSTSVDIGDGHAGKIAGDLTFHGVTKPVTLDVVFNGAGKGVPGGDTRAGFSASTTIKRSDFGVAKFVPLIGDQVQLVIEAEFKKQ